MTPYDIIIDTNVLAAALRSRRGASFRLISLLPDTRFRLHVSVGLIFEYEDVLKRADLGISLPVDQLDQFLDYIVSIAKRHEIFYLWRPHLRDAGDDFILELAVSARCDFIVTYNTRDFEGSERFGIRAITPGEFLQQIGEVE